MNASQEKLKAFVVIWILIAFSVDSPDSEIKTPKY